MASVPQRHTYYGGETGGVFEHKADFMLNGGQHRQKRKHVTFGPYILGSTLGEGEFGRVKLGWSKNTSPNEVSKAFIASQHCEIRGSATKFQVYWNSTGICIRW